MNKYKKLTEFIAENYEPLNDWLYFNTISMQDGNASLNTIESANAQDVYIDGSKEVSLEFAIAMIKEYDMGTSDVNVDAIDEVNNFMAWIDEQNKNSLYPNFESGIIVHSMNVLDSTPSLSVDNEQNLAKYQFTCSIDYLEKGSS